MLEINKDVYFDCKKTQLKYIAGPDSSHFPPPPAPPFSSTYAFICADVEGFVLLDAGPLKVKFPEWIFVFPW